MTKTVLVTGASGFIGRPLSERLEQAGCTVIRHSQSRRGHCVLRAARQGRGSRVSSGGPNLRAG